MARPNRKTQTEHPRKTSDRVFANPTLEDVARLAGVSRATASRALATPDKVSSKAKRRSRTRSQRSAMSGTVRQARSPRAGRS